ncbi:hypothetical protein B0H17DRAFT_927443, partial [Mycena rosella]
CTKCDPPVILEHANNQHTLGHNGSHILFDKSIRRSDQPCGLCLRPWPMCYFVLGKATGPSRARQIDWRYSKCLNLLKFQMVAAQKSTKNSPCTNHLILCPLQCGQGVWTSNLTAHYTGEPLNLLSLDSVPSVYVMAPGERERMSQIWRTRMDQPTKPNIKQKAPNRHLISAPTARAMLSGISYLIHGSYL